MRKFKHILIFIILLLNTSNALAITRADFLAGLFDSRGLDWSNSPEALSNDPAGFMLRTGYVNEDLDNLNSPVTRREALRWCIESLGLSFEAELLSDYPLNFSDVKNLTQFERGCLVVATNMVPLIFTPDEKFRGYDKLNDEECRIILDRMRQASTALSLNMIRNPVKGLRAYIHREGVPTGIPSWRVYADGIANRNSAVSTQKFLKANGFDLSITQGGGAYGLRTQRLEDYNQVKKLIALIKSRGLKYRVLPSMTNTNTRIVPRYWVMLTIDPTFWKMLPINSKNGPQELMTLSRIASQNKAKAAVNAGFFAITKGGKGYPIGALKINGEFISAPYNNRGCLGWNDDDEAIFSLASNDVNYWYDMNNVIQAGPLMLDEGQPVKNDEGFNSALISARHPRSAVGLNEDGQWVFVVVDGRNGLHSSGATISELTEILRSNKVLYALNLDGGGSSEIIINGKIYNLPSDGYERLISYGLGAISVE